MQRALWIVGLLAIFAAAATLAIGIRQTREGGRWEQSIGRGPGSTPSVAGQILGKNVQNPQGQDLGRVIALSTREGRIAYILVSKPGRRDWVPIPPGAAHLNPQQDAVILKDVDVARMAKAPALDPDEPQMLDDPYFESEVRSYYGLGSGRGADQPTRP